MPQALTLAIAAIVLPSLFALAASPGDQPAEDPSENPAKAHIERFRANAADGGMERWQESMQPDTGHAVLAQLAGEWDLTFRAWHSQDQPPVVSHLTSTSTMTMGGLFLEERGEGEMFGQPVEIRILMGYDNVRNLFHATLFDSMTPAPRFLKGNLNEDGTVLTMVGEMDEPITGELGKAFMAKWTFLEPDRYTYELFEILYGDPFRVVEVTATRRD